MAKIYCIGEALIDFVPSIKGTRLEDVPSFSGLPGGAPANLAVAVCKLGAEGCFIGKVGSDAFGRLLSETLQKYGVDTTNLFFTSDANTTLAFVSLTTSGDRDFVFYRKPGADMLLDENEIKPNLFQKGDVLHYGSLGLVESPSKYAHRKAISLMKQAGGILSFDPNVRLDLWNDHNLCKQTILEFLPENDIIKVSLDEMPFIFDSDNENVVAERCFSLGVKAVMITRGAAGSAFYTPNYSTEIEALDVKVEDTTGAGDAYTGAILSRIGGAENIAERLTPENIDSMIKFANTVGSITTMKKGGIDSIPTFAEVKAFEL